MTEYKAMTHGRHGADPLQMHRDRLRLHLLPYFDDSHLSEVTSGAVQQYRAHRLAEPEQDARSEGAPVGRGGPKGWKPPGRKTVEDEIETLRMVLETAQRHGWIDRIPDLSDPYEPTPKAKPKLWFTPWEYRQLCAALRRNAENPAIGRDKVEAGQLRDYVIFMVNTGLTPAEADALQYRDVQVVRDDTDEQILEIAVHGSDGINYCHSTLAAVSAFERMLARNRPRPDDLLFSDRIRKLFNDILKASNLKLDRKGKARTADSLRHSYICFRLLEGVSLHEVAENCRTSVETIEKHYAREELVAEIGAAFLCADLDIEPAIREDHAPYIANWLKVLENDHRAIFTAAAHAQRAADFLHGLQSKEDSDDDEDRAAA